jgi:hypothetical protein
LVWLLSWLLNDIHGCWSKWSDLEYQCRRECHKCFTKLGCVAVNVDNAVLNVIQMIGEG